MTAKNSSIRLEVQSKATFGQSPRNETTSRTAYNICQPIFDAVERSLSRPLNKGQSVPQTVVRTFLATNVRATDEMFHQHARSTDTLRRSYNQLFCVVKMFV